MTANFDYHLKPLLLAETSVSALLNGNLIGADIQKGAGPSSPPFNDAKNQAGVLIIRGTLFPSTYQRIEEMIEAMAEEYGAIILDINSPGGLVAGCFDLSDRIYLIRQKTPVYAFVGEACYSAAYCLASAANKIYLARSAGVGSVGVIAVHVDQSVLNDRVGLKFTPIYAGAKKNDRSPHAPLSDRAAADLQKSIDDSYNTLCSTVARNRGMLAESVKKTEAGIYCGKDAVDAGLVDIVASRREAFLSIASLKNSTTTPQAKAVTPKPKAKPKGPNLLLKDAETRAKAAEFPTDSIKDLQRPAATPARPSYLH